MQGVLPIFMFESTMFFGPRKPIPPPKFAPQPRLDKLTGEAQEPEMEDPEVVAARLEQEAKRKEKHRKMEAEREKIRQHIREKYNLKKKEDPKEREEITGRITGNRKTPEQVAMETLADEDDGILGQLGIAETYERAKTAVASAVNSARAYFNLTSK
ncbi:unnamed protein product [Caenorhabditis angaria]|uniref:Complexin n=1 Tax=Caenorhabditis angaria TaxID=860376 RepID=A0A9P1J0A1_9PELO|nr:unnamed protein product [Caenorhabditis angaria]